MASPARTSLRQALASTSSRTPVRISRRALSQSVLRPRFEQGIPHRAWRRVPGEGRGRGYSTVVNEAAVTQMPEISKEDTYDIVIIGAGNAGLALACTLCKLLLSTHRKCLAHHTIVSKPALMRDDTRILLVEGGSLDRVRSWTGRGEWENRVSSLTAENVQFLRGESDDAWKTGSVLMPSRYWSVGAYRGISIVSYQRYHRESIERRPNRHLTIGPRYGQPTTQNHHPRSTFPSRAPPNQWPE